ncbi:ATP-binding protein [Candidatus Acetothermia bacterium]|nr:ATP-binding protein [Candidatus Acetothermia bacterium]
MNDNHSSHKWIYKPRWISPLLKKAVEVHPVVVLSGARQVGKSTLLQHADPIAQWRYLTLDDFDVQTQVARDPAALWAGADRIVFDEVQKAPSLMNAIKRAVDTQKKMRFCLSGSANLLLMQQISESLAGRAVYFTLYPMTYGEAQGQPVSERVSQLLQGKLPREGTQPRLKDQDDLVALLLRGFMPSLVDLADAEDWGRWWEGYVITYLERDLRQFARIEALADFRRVMMALALRSGQLLNQTEVSRDTSVPQPTVHRYLNVLESGHLLERLPAYAINRTKRLIKSPKLYWLDPGLAAHLSGFYDTTSLEAARELGGLFETLVFHHLRVHAQRLSPRAHLYYWRTASGEEVDFVLEWGRQLLAVEVKLAQRPRYADVGGLVTFLREYPEARAGLLVHTGQEIRRLDEKIIAVPWHWLSI